ncbi:MAG: protein kinase family protein [Verrucomicrobiota bacterium]|nr:protein kinase family protein [Verrucomicrobiota bacterium]
MVKIQSIDDTNQLAVSGKDRGSTYRTDLFSSREAPEMNYSVAEKIYQFVQENYPKWEESNKIQNVSLKFSVSGENDQPKSLEYKIQYDPSTKDVFVETGEEVGKGGYKKVTGAVRYILRQSVVQLTPKADLTEEAQEIVTREIEFYEMFRGSPYVIQLHAHLPASSFNKTEVIFLERAYKNLWQCAKEIPLDQKRRIARQLLAGLSFFHESGVVHADLNPGNVVFIKNLNGHFTPKYIDFGLAYRYSTDTTPLVPEHSKIQAEKDHEIASENKLNEEGVRMIQTLYMSGKIDLKTYHVFLDKNKSMHDEKIKEINEKYFPKLRLASHIADDVKALGLIFKVLCSNSDLEQDPQMKSLISKMVRDYARDRLTAKQALDILNSFEVLPNPPSTEGA